MTRKDRFNSVLEYFRKEMPSAETELHYETPFQLLVAVILSAQCTDRRVNMVTPELFRHFPSAESLSKASPEEVFKFISSISYPNAKSRHLVGMAKRIVDGYGGEIPSDTAALMTLPGVGRKTANVIASVIYDKPVIAVDTHVFRVSHRIGLSDGKTPTAVETDLERHIPETERPTAHHWLILHGRYTCTAKSPKCEACGIKDFCRYYISNNRI